MLIVFSYFKKTSLDLYLLPHFPAPLYNKNHCASYKDIYIYIYLRIYIYIYLLSSCFSLTQTRFYSHYPLTQQFVIRSSMISILINPTVSVLTWSGLFVAFDVVVGHRLITLSFPKHSLLGFQSLGSPPALLAVPFSLPSWFLLNFQNSKHWHAPELDL